MRTCDANIDEVFENLKAPMKRPRKNSFNNEKIQSANILDLVSMILK